MAGVTADDEIWQDSRFECAAVLLGWPDADLVRIKFLRIVSWQTEKFTDDEPTYCVPRAVIVGAFMSTAAPDALVESGLASEEDGAFRISGSVGRIEWLSKERGSRRAGGLARSAGAERSGGRFKSQQLPAADQLPTSSAPAGDQLATSNAPAATRSTATATATVKEEERESGKPDAPASDAPDPWAGIPRAVRELAETACAEINRHTGSGYEPESKNTIALCRSLHRARHTPDEVRLVVADKVREWKGTKVAGRLVPKTLLALSNFETYLEELRKRPGAHVVRPARTVRDDDAPPMFMFDDITGPKKPAEPS